MKVARQVSAIPALGTNFPLHKIQKLVTKGFKRAVVWLDDDKWREGRQIAENLSMVGISSRALLTELDPKEYSNEQITEYLK